MMPANIFFLFSAAIYGLRGKKDISVFILHPHGKISPVQAAQMTTVLDNNVHNLAVKGTFDDCQVNNNNYVYLYTCELLHFIHVYLI